MTNKIKFLSNIKDFLFEVLSARHNDGFSYFKTFMDFPRWKKYLNKNSLECELPWISFRAIDYLNKKLKKEMLIFEYGSGGSTLFFSKRVSKVISVEHDNDWYRNISLLLKEKKIFNIDLKLSLPERDEFFNNKSISNPFDYISDDALSINKTFKNYSESIDSFPEGYFDLVVIDGRARPSCILHAIKKIKVGGYLLLDNSERAYYLQDTQEYLDNFKMVLSSYGPVPYVRSFSKTTIWVKFINK